MRCPNCNSEIPEGKRFCGYCGRRLEPTPTPEPFDDDAPTRLFPEEPAPPARPAEVQPQPPPDAPTPPPPVRRRPSPEPVPSPRLPTRKRGVPGWAWGLGGLAAVACLLIVVVAVVIPALGKQMQPQFEEAMPPAPTARPTSPPASTLAPTSAPEPTHTLVPEEPTPEPPTSAPPPSHWEAEVSVIELTHGGYETIASGTGDFVVVFEMTLLDEGAGDGQINFNIQGPGDSHIVAIELSTGKYATQGGAGTASWAVSNAIETGTDATNLVEIIGENDTLIVAVNREVLAEFDHTTTGADNVVYITVYHDVWVSIDGIYAEGIN
jgi:hypothetical protein